MRRLTFIVLALGFLLILPNYATSEKDLSNLENALLGQSELEQRFENIQYFDYKNNKGMVFTIIYYPNGTLEIIWKGDKKEGNDTGTYRIINKQIYNTWKIISNGKEKCFRFFKTGDYQYRTVSSDVSWK